MPYKAFIKNCIFYRLRKKIPIGHILDLSSFTEEELEDFYKRVGKNVKKYRKEKNMTQLQLALDIDHNSVGYIAKAELYKYKKHFSLEQIYKIAKVLDVKPSKLIDV